MESKGKFSGFVNLMKEKISKKKKEKREAKQGYPDWMKGNTKALAFHKALEKRKKDKARQKREMSGPTKY